MPIAIPRLRRKPRLGARLDRQHPLSRGLVGCWLFNEGGGDKLWDISGKSNATPNSATPSHSWVSRGLFLDQSSTSAFDIGGSAITSALNNSAFSIVFKFFPLSVSRGMVLGKKGASNSRCIAIFNGWGVGISIVEEGVAVIATTGANLSFNQTYQVAWTYSNGANTVLVNTDIAATASRVFSGNYSGSYQLGDSSGGAPPNQIMDTLSVYDRALSTDEIRELYLDPWCNIQAPAPRRSFIAVGGASGTVSKNATDTLSCSISESITLLVYVSETDSLSVGITEAQTSLLSSTVTDTPTIGITENLQAQNSFTVTDTLSVAITEALSIFESAAKNVTDTLSVAISESLTLAVTVMKSATDTLSIAITESLSLAQTTITAAIDFVWQMGTFMFGKRKK